MVDLQKKVFFAIMSSPFVRDETPSFPEVLGFSLLSLLVIPALRARFLCRDKFVIGLLFSEAIASCGVQFRQISFVLICGLFQSIYCDGKIK